MHTWGLRATADGCPAWVPGDVRAYLIHTIRGRSIREMARDAGVEPSTILRRVRRIESRRDDVLVDMALASLERSIQRSEAAARGAMERATLTHANQTDPVTDETFEDEALRILRRLSEQGAVLALAPSMDTAVVVRETGDGPALRTAMVRRNVAEAMALKAWITASGSGRVLRYRITQAGRAMLRDRVACDESRLAREAGIVEVGRGEDKAAVRGAGRPGARYNLSESPLVGLSRRRDRDDKPFLSDGLVAAGERLREDFELALMGPKMTQNWERFLTSVSGGARNAAVPVSGDARSRVEAALAALGPGLGDVALRCCCYLEGLEATEKRMGWSARSGKIVLRIALQRLKMHYDECAGGWSPLIGAEEVEAKRA